MVGSGDKEHEGGERTETTTVFFHVLRRTMPTFSLPYSLASMHPRWCLLSVYLHICMSTVHCRVPPPPATYLQRRCPWTMTMTMAQHGAHGGLSNSISSSTSIRTIIIVLDIEIGIEIGTTGRGRGRGRGWGRGSLDIAGTVTGRTRNLMRESLTRNQIPISRLVVLAAVAAAPCAPCAPCTPCTPCTPRG